MGKKRAQLHWRAAVLGTTCCEWFEQPATKNKTTNPESKLAFFIVISLWYLSKDLVFLVSRLALLEVVFH